MPPRNEKKMLLLGTALWGWKVPKATAFSILDTFIEAGFNWVDCALNYPINGQAEDMGLAIKWLAEWQRSNPANSFFLFLKLGAASNLYSPESRLDAASLAGQVAGYSETFGASLKGIGIHWDNRGREETEFPLIAETLDFFSKLEDQGYLIGFSGVAHPKVYQELAPQLAEKWFIQVKENMLTSEARKAYLPFFPRAKYISYGINMGGIKSGTPPLSNSSLALRNIKHDPAVVERLNALLKQETLPPIPKNLNDLALSHNYRNNSLAGTIIGPSTIEQTLATLEYWKALCDSGEYKK